MAKTPIKETDLVIIEVKNTDYELNGKDAALIESLKELTNQIRRVANGR